MILIAIDGQFCDFKMRFCVCIIVASYEWRFYFMIFDDSLDPRIYSWVHQSNQIITESLNYYYITFNFMFIDITFNQWYDAHISIFPNFSMIEHYLQT